MTSKPLVLEITSHKVCYFTTPQKASTIGHKTSHDKGPENFEYGPSSGHIVTSFHSFYLFLNHPGTEIISHKHQNSYFIEISSAKTQLSRVSIQTAYIHDTHRVPRNPRVGLKSAELS